MLEVTRLTYQCPKKKSSCHEESKVEKKYDLNSYGLYSWRTRPCTSWDNFNTVFLRYYVLFISFWLTNLSYKPSIYKYVHIILCTQRNDKYHNKYFQPRNFVSISPATKRICNQPSNGTYQGSTNQSKVWDVHRGLGVINGRSEAGKS